MTAEDVAFADVITAIYGTVLSRSASRECWEAALRTCIAYLGASEGQIAQPAPDRPGHQRLLGVAADRSVEAVSDLQERFATRDVFSAGRSLCLEFADEEGLREPTTLTFLFDVLDYAGWVAARERAHELRTHIERALRLGSALHDTYRRHDAVLELVDRLSGGLLILDREARVIVANDAAHDLMERMDEIELSDDGLLQHRLPALSEAIGKAVDAACRAGLEERRTWRMSLPLRDKGGSVLMEIEPRRRDDHSSRAQEGCALVTLIDPNTLPVPNRERLASLFSLSAAETEVCELMLRGLTNHEIADRRCVSTETVRTQVTSVLRKTKATRRTELFRLIAAASPPMLA